MSKTRSSSNSESFRVISSLTNDRQAAKILDIRNDSALVLRQHKREHYIQGTEAGLYLVSYGRGGGLYMSRIVAPGQIRALANSADEIDVEQEPRKQAVRYPAVDGDDVMTDGGQKSMPHSPDQTVLFDKWLGKASENIEDWGVQDETILLLAMLEELGELAQAYLEANFEGAPESQICQELDDLGALLLQFHIARHETPLQTRNDLATDGGTDQKGIVDCPDCGEAVEAAYLGTADADDHAGHIVGWECLDCGAELREHVNVHGATVDLEVIRDDPVVELLDELDQLGSVDDPTVAIFDGHDALTVYAEHEDGLRMLSSWVIHARDVDVDDFRDACDRFGEPRLVDLSTQKHRFDADDFEEVADLD